MKFAPFAMDAIRPRAPSRVRVGAGLLGASLGLVPATWVAAFAAGPVGFLAALTACTATFLGGVAVVNGAMRPEHVVVPVEVPATVAAETPTPEPDPRVAEAPAA